jgi:hypothetical protein
VSAARLTLAALVCLLAAPVARAQGAGHDPVDPAAFARGGTWVLGFDQGVLWPDGSAATASRRWTGGEVSYTLALRGEIDRFITDWLSAGLLAGVGYSRLELAGMGTQASRSEVFGLRVGFAAPIRGRSVFWPRLTGLVAHGKDGTGMGFSVHAPFVRQVGPGFLVGFGPAYEYRHQAGHRHGGGLLLSFGGAFPVGEAQSPDTGPPRERFGQAGQWAVSIQRGIASGQGTSAYWTQISEPGQTTGSLLLLTSMDCFVADHVSIGFAAGLGKVGQLRDNVGLEGTAVFLGGQLGGAIPVGGPVVIRPVASVLWSAGGGTTSRWTQLYLPVAVELGHFLLGLGPSLEWYRRGADLPEDRYTLSVLGLTLFAAGWWR